MNPLILDSTPPRTSLRINVHPYAEISLVKIIYPFNSIINPSPLPQFHNTTTSDVLAQKNLPKTLRNLIVKEQ